MATQGRKNLRRGPEYQIDRIQGERGLAMAKRDVSCGTLVFHADTSTKYSSGPYSLYWTTRGWDAYKWIGLKQRCLARELTLGQALDLAKEDALQTTQG